MITFACKRIEKKDLIKCSFELNKTEYNVLIFLLNAKELLNVSEIAHKMDLERTTVQKAVKNLVDKNLVRKLQKNLEKGGYMYLYKANEKNEIKQKMKKIIHNWYLVAEKEISKL